MHSTEILQRWSPRPEGDLIYGTPFVVRGHHLANLRPIVTGEKAPDELIQEMVSSAIRLRNWMPFDAIDIIGITQEERYFFQETLAKYFERFRDLPEDFPVRIVAGQEDGICSGCAVGNHCSKPVNDEADLNFIARFYLAKQLLDADGNDSRKLVTGIDDTGRPFLDTNAGLVREILGNVRLESMGKPDFELFAIRDPDGGLISFPLGQL